MGDDCRGKRARILVEEEGFSLPSPFLDISTVKDVDEAGRLKEKLIGGLALCDKLSVQYSTVLAALDDYIKNNSVADYVG
ncbi:hypothetical protein LINGRAHAP2_LOCUS15425, partial [Linum grandiflorum]